MRSLEPDDNLSNLMGWIRLRDGKAHTFVWLRSARNSHARGALDSGVNGPTPYLSSFCWLVILCTLASLGTRSAGNGWSCSKSAPCVI
jgi:hypothetical protein